MHDELNTLLDRISADQADKDVFLRSEKGTWPGGLWQALHDAGVPQACLPEAQGGPGLEFQDAMVALKRSAYHGLPVPLAETMIATRLLMAAGMTVPAGVLSVNVGHSRDDLCVEGSGQAARLTGRAHRVPWANDCDHGVFVALHAGQTFLVVVDRQALATAVVQTSLNLAGEPRCDVRFDGAPVVSMERLADAPERLRLEGALLRSVQMAGALQRALDSSIQYANERVQFGRPIGKFQAVQHMLAVLAGQVAASSAAADAAVGGSTSLAHALLTAVAKSRIGEAAGKGVEIAHQVHGAMGFTREHGLHHVTRRLWAWRDEFGNETHWQTRIGQEVARQGADQLWSMLTAL